MSIIMKVSYMKSNNRRRYIPGVYSIKVTSNERGKGDGIVTMLHNGRFRNDVWAYGC
jgi:hypothetical protein